MKLINKITSITLIIITVIIIFSGCKKSSQPDPGEGNGSGTVQGVITDLNNSPVSNATVTGGSATATTDASGKFILNQVQFNSGNVVVIVTKSGFFEGVKSFVSVNHTVSNATIRLIPKTVSGTFAASSGGNVTIQGGGSVNFGPGFVTASNGNAYSGNVSVSALYLNPTDLDFGSIMPGEMAVSVNNQTGTLQSFGVVAVEINDAGGNKLQLAQGKTATITLPIPAALLNKAPANIPLWYFDNTRGLWKQEGIAAKQGNNYIGFVNHFSFWSVGDIAVSINLKLSFRDTISGAPFVNKLVTIIRIDSTGGGGGTVATNGLTDSAGTVSGLVPVNEVLNMKVFGDCGAVLYSKNIGPFSKDTVLPNTLIKNSCPDTTQSDFVVYVAGYEYNVAGISAAKYWKNDTAIAITYGTINSFANSIAVVDDYVYAAVRIEGLGAGSWTNKYVASGETGLFGGTSPNSGANSIAVVGSDVYVAGYEYNGDVSVARYWGPPQWLAFTDGTKNAMANSVAVDGSNVYVAGYENNNSGISVAIYWKNGQAIALSDGTKMTYAKSIAVSGGDVYVAGDESSSIAKYWKNGVAIPLTDGAHPSTANSIAVVGSDVYVAGSDNNVARYWKNGQAITLPGGTSASSIAIEGNDVYVAGYGYNGSVSVAKYWINGVGITLTDGTYNANATSIFVVKR